jgi:predicted nucleic acid-binding protein
LIERTPDATLRVRLELDPSILRTLDAFRVAAARLVGAELADVIAYDERMADVARTAGLRVETPGRGSA